MTHLGPEKKGLGLDAIAPAEPSYFAGSADIRPRRWWLTGRSLASSVVFGTLWSLYAVFRLVEIALEPRVSGTDWLLLALSSFLALGSVPSIVFFLRSPHRRVSSSSSEMTSRLNGPERD